MTLAIPPPMPEKPTPCILEEYVETTDIDTLLREIESDGKLVKKVHIKRQFNADGSIKSSVCSVSYGVIKK